MDSTNFDDMMEPLLREAESVIPTLPSVFYNEDGDCIEFLIAHESHYAERVDKLLTVFYGRESGEIVGSLIKGVKRFIAHEGVRPIAPRPQHRRGDIPRPRPHGYSNWLVHDTFRSLSGWLADKALSPADILPTFALKCQSATRQPPSLNQPPQRLRRNG